MSKGDIVSEFLSEIKVLYKNEMRSKIILIR